MLMFGSAVDQTKPAAPAEVFDAKQNKCSFKLLSQNAKHTLRAFPLWKDNIAEAVFGCNQILMNQWEDALKAGWFLDCCSSQTICK